MTEGVVLYMGRSRTGVRGWGTETLCGRITHLTRQGEEEGDRLQSSEDRFTRQDRFEDRPPSVDLVGLVLVR